jgi:hypothetical protein
MRIDTEKHQRLLLITLASDWGAKILLAGVEKFKQQRHFFFSNRDDAIIRDLCGALDALAGM